MTEPGPELSIISGNPDSMELAAIVAAYKSYLSSIGDRAVDIDVENQSLWTYSRNLTEGSNLENALLAGKTRKWSDINRIKARI